ncbi:MAG: quinol:cytochrome C oxidoreductase [Flavobacteriales bacterium]|nr:quinol:cytochrome C oxidoreductase [Flavobacteriales bacterium]
MGHHIITEIESEKYEFTSKSRRIVGAVFVLGLILTILGIVQLRGGSADASHEADTAAVEQHDDHAMDAASHEEASDAHYADAADAAHAEGGHDAEGDHAAAAGHGHGSTWVTRLWANILMNSYYFMLFAIAAMFFIAVNYAANAGWSTLLKKVAEAITSYLPVAFITIAIVLFVGSGELYHWLDYFNGEKTPGTPEYDAIMESKAWFLNNGWFYVGVPVIMLIWILFRWKIKGLSRKEDQEGGTTYFLKSIRFSAGFIVFFAFSFSILSWLVLMSLDAHWFSTIYSVYNFAIAFVTGLTVICMFTIYLKSKGYMSAVSDEVIHDLGKFMFAFSIFWAYIWLAQFLLIWYANLPEEVVYYDARLTDTFKPLFRTNIIMCFFLPFLILMMRNAKRHPKVLMLAGAIILLGHWLDMYLMVMPGTVGESASIGLLEIGMTMTFAGFFIYWVLHNLSKDQLYPMNHPYLLESVNHDVGV